MAQVWGKCRCKIRYNIIKKTECIDINKSGYWSTILDQLLPVFLKCKFMGKNSNSKCEQDIKRCDCNYGYSYDLKLNKCVQCGKKEGIFQSFL